MFDFLQHSFMIQALILGLVLCVSAALLSPFLVYSNQSMIADGLSHIAFTGVILGFLVSDEPLYIAIPFSIVASIGITLLSSRGGIQSDASIGVVSAFALAVGLIVATVGPGFNRSIESLLVGNILTTTNSELWVAIALFIIIAVFMLLNYRRMISLTYDTSYATFLGIKTTRLRYMIAALTAVFVVIGVRTVGTLLISALLIFPALIGGYTAKSFSKTYLIGVLSSIVVVFVGMMLAYNFGLPTGASIVLVYTFVLVIAYIVKMIRRV